MNRTPVSRRRLERDLERGGPALNGRRWWTSVVPLSCALVPGLVTFAWFSGAFSSIGLPTLLLWLAGILPLVGLSCGVTNVLTMAQRRSVIFYAPFALLAMLNLGFWVTSARWLAEDLDAPNIDRGIVMVLGSLTLSTLLPVAALFAATRRRDRSTDLTRT